MLIFDETSIQLTTSVAKKKSDEIIQKVIERDTRESKFKLL